MILARFGYKEGKMRVKKDFGYLLSTSGRNLVIFFFETWRLKNSKNTKFSPIWKGQKKRSSRAELRSKFGRKHNDARCEAGGGGGGGETDQIIPLTVLAALQQQQQQPKLPPRPLPSPLQRQQRDINLPERGLDLAGRQI